MGIIVCIIPLIVAIGILRSIRTLVTVAIFEIYAIESLIEKALRPVIRFKIKGQIVREIKMKDTEKATATLEVDDAKGYPTGAGFDQPPVWAVEDESIATLKPSDDGMSCDVIGQKPGNTKLSVAGVAGGQSYQGECPVVIVAGDAASIKVTLGEAVAQ